MGNSYKPPSWKEIPLGVIIDKPGSSKEYKTGDWRSQRPVRNQEKCARCGLCWISCPDAAIDILPDGKHETNYDYCKGCFICVNVCPTKCISIEAEVT